MDTEIIALEEQTIPIKIEDYNDYAFLQIIIVFVFLIIIFFNKFL